MPSSDLASGDDMRGLERLRKIFAGDQLRVARDLQRLTQAELARSAGEAGRTKLTSAAISQFELGLAVPTATTLAALSAALEVDAEFLTTAAVDAEADLPAFFRSLRAAPSQERKRARNQVQLVHRLAQVLDDIVGLPARSLPSIPSDPYAEPRDRAAAAADAAATVRKMLKLERGPVPDVVDCLEAHGVVCARLKFQEARIDAFSVNFSDHPVAVLATDKDKWDRSRFDAAHELGHLVMHEEAAGVAEAEKQAHEFAAAFLMPARDIRSELPATADWRRLKELKAEWGVSIAALLRRAKTLEVMSEGVYVSATKVMSARGWRRHEPVNRDPEVPALLRTAIRKARRGGITAEDLRRRALIPQSLFDEICMLIEG